MVRETEHRKVQQSGSPDQIGTLSTSLNTGINSGKPVDHKRRDGSTYRIKTIEDPWVTRKKVLDRVLDVEKHALLVYHTIRRYPGYAIIAESLKRDTSLLQISEIPHVFKIDSIKLADAMGIVARKSMAMLLDESLGAVRDDVKHIYQSAVSVIASLTHTNTDEIKEESYRAGKVISQLLALDKYLVSEKKSQPTLVDMRFLQLQTLTEACMANLEKNGSSAESCSEVCSALAIAADFSTGLFGIDHGYTVGLKNCLQEVVELFFTVNPPGQVIPTTQRTITLDHGDLISALPRMLPSTGKAIASYMSTQEDHLCEKDRSLRQHIMRQHNFTSNVYGRMPMRFLQPDSEGIRTANPEIFLDTLLELLLALKRIEYPIVYAPPFDHHVPYLPGSTNCFMYACPDNWHTLKVACNALLLANELLSREYQVGQEEEEKVYRLYRILSGKERYGFIHSIPNLMRMHFYEREAHLTRSEHLFCYGKAALPSGGAKTDSSPQLANQPREDNITAEEFPKYELRGLDTEQYLPSQNPEKLLAYIKQSNTFLQCILKTAEDRRKLPAEAISAAEETLLIDIEEARAAIESAEAAIHFMGRNNNQAVLLLMQEMVATLTESFEKTATANNIKAYLRSAKPLLREYSGKLHALPRVDANLRKNAENIISATEKAFFPALSTTQEAASATTEDNGAIQIATSSHNTSDLSEQVAQPTSADLAKALKECEKLIDSLQNVATVECPRRNAAIVTDNLKYAFSRVAHARVLGVADNTYCTPLKSASSSILGALTTIHPFKPLASTAKAMTLLRGIQRCAKILDKSLQAALTEETDGARAELLLNAQKSATAAFSMIEYLDVNSEVIEEYSVARMAQKTLESCMKDLSNAYSFQPVMGQVSAPTNAYQRTRYIHVQAALSANSSIIYLLQQHATSWHEQHERDIKNKVPSLYSMAARDLLLLNLYEALQSMQYASRCFEGDPPSALLNTCQDLEHLIHKNVFAGMAFTSPDESLKSIHAICERAPSLLTLVNETQELEESKLAAVGAINRASILLKRSSYALARETNDPEIFSESSGIATFPGETAEPPKHQGSTSDAQPIAATTEPKPQSRISYLISKTISYLRDKFLPNKSTENEISGSIDSSVQSVKLLLENMKQYSSQSLSAKAQPWENVANFCNKSLTLTKAALKSKLHSDILDAACHLIGSIFTIDGVKTLPTISHDKTQLAQLDQLGNEMATLKKKLHTYAEYKKDTFKNTAEGVVVLQPSHTDLFISWDTLNAAWWQHERGLSGLEKAIKEMKCVYGSNVKIKAHVHLLETLFQQQDWQSIDFICRNCTVCGANGNAAFQEVVDLFQRNLRNEENKQSDFPVKSTQSWWEKILSFFTKKKTPKSRDDVPSFLKALIENSCVKTTDSLTRCDYYKLPNCNIDSIISSLYENPAYHHIAAFLLYKCLEGRVHVSTLIKCQSTATIYGLFDAKKTGFHTVIFEPQDGTITPVHPPAMGNALVRLGAKHTYATTFLGFLPDQTKTKAQHGPQSFLQKVKLSGHNALSSDKAPSHVKTTTSTSHSGKARRKIMLNGIDIYTGEKYYDAEKNSEDLASATPPGVTTSIEHSNSQSTAPIIPTASSSTYLLFDDKANHISTTNADEHQNAKYLGTISEVAVLSQTGDRYKKVLTVRSYCRENTEQGASVSENCNGGFGKSPERMSAIAAKAQFVRSLDESESGYQGHCGVGAFMKKSPRTLLVVNPEAEKELVPSQHMTLTSECVSVHGANEQKADMDVRRL